MNRVFLSGNLTRDPEVRYTQSGMAFARMGIAVNRRSKEKDAVDFFNLTAWEKTAEFCGRYLTKGSRVLVEGRLQTSSYEKNGVKVTAVDIMVNNIEFASSKRDSSDGDDGGYRRDTRFDDGDDYQRSPRFNDGDDYQRGSRSNDDGYRRNDYRPPERDNQPPKKPNDEFDGDPLELDDPPF